MTGSIDASVQDKEYVWRSQGQWTYKEYRRLPDDGWRYEIIAGELLMAPAPRERHQYASAELAFVLTQSVKTHDPGRVYAAPFEVRFSDTDVVQPDIIFIRTERLAEVITEEGANGAPDLVAEILSPSNWLIDRRDKPRLYERYGVPEYWIVDPDKALVEVCVLRRGAYELSGKWKRGESARSEVLPGCEVAVGSLWHE